VVSWLIFTSPLVFSTHNGDVTPQNYGYITFHCPPQYATHKAQNGDIMSHYLPQTAAHMHHPQYGTSANIPDTYAHCLFGVLVGTYGTHSENTLWHQKYCRSSSTVMMFIFILHGMHVPKSVLIHSTLLSFTILSISDKWGPVVVLACLSFAACPLETDGPNPPPLSSVHIQHHR